MRIKRQLAIFAVIAAVFASGPAKAQFGAGGLPSLFSEVQRMQLLAVGPLVFEDADTARIGDLNVQLFGVDAPDIDESCTVTPDNRATCGLIALTFTLDRVDDVETVDCLIVDVGENKTIFVDCLSEEFRSDISLDRETKSLGEILILSGFARADEDVEGPESGRYQAAELEAQRQSNGFWDCDEFTPRSWSSDKNRICN